MFKNIYVPDVLENWFEKTTEGICNNMTITSLKTIDARLSSVKDMCESIINSHKNSDEAKVKYVLTIEANKVRILESILNILKNKKEKK